MYAAQAGEARGSHLHAVEGGKELDRILKHVSDNNAVLRSMIDDLDMLANRMGLFAPPATAESKGIASGPPDGLLPMIQALAGSNTEMLAQMRGVIDRLQRAA